MTPTEIAAEAVRHMYSSYSDQSLEDVLLFAPAPDSQDVIDLLFKTALQDEIQRRKEAKGEHDRA